MEPSILDVLAVTPTYIQKEVSSEAEQIGVPNAGVLSSNEYLQHACELLTDISQQLQFQQPDDITSPIMLQSVVPTTLSNRGRKYTNLLLGGSSNQPITIYVPGVGTYSVTLQPGWNTIGAPDRSDIQLSPSATQNPLPLLLRYSNVAYGGMTIL